MVAQILPIRFERLETARGRFPMAMLEIFNPPDLTRIPAEDRCNVFDVEFLRWGFRVIASLDRVDHTIERHISISRIYGPEFEDRTQQVIVGAELIEEIANFVLRSPIKFLERRPHPEVEGEIHYFI